MAVIGLQSPVSVTQHCKNSSRLDELPFVDFPRTVLSRNLRSLHQAFFINIGTSGSASARTSSPSPRRKPSTASIVPSAPPPDTATAPPTPLAPTKLPPHRHTPLRPIHTRGQIRNAQRIARRTKNRLRRSHPVDHAEDLELRLQFIRHKIHGNVGLADRVLHGQSQFEPPSRSHARLRSA